MLLVHEKIAADRTLFVSHPHWAYMYMYWYVQKGPCIIADEMPGLYDD